VVAPRNRSEFCPLVGKPPDRGEASAAAIAEDTVRVWQPEERKVRSESRINPGEILIDSWSR